MNNKYLINLDLDGTLLKESKELFDKNDEYWIKFIEIYNELTSKGHVICINTGRTFNTSSKIYDGVGMKTPISNTNGTFIHNPHDSQFPVYKSTVDKDLINKVLCKAKYQEYFFMASYTTEGILSIMFKNINNLPNVYKNILNNFGVIPIKSTKVLSNFSSIRMRFKTGTNVVQDFAKELDKNLRYTIYPKGSEHGYDVIEISMKEASKGKALDYIAKTLGFDNKHTIAIGDDSNDIELMKHAHISVAMKNGIQELKDVCKEITNYTNTEGGVSKFLEEFFKDKL